MGSVRDTIEQAGNISFCEHEGFWFFPWRLSAVENTVKNFKPLSSDVILASFPKTGTTWLKSLLFSIVHRSSIQSLTENNPHEIVPSLELQVFLKESNGDFSSSAASPSLPSFSSRRIFSTHIPYQLFKKNLDSSDCRVVYVTRNPKDTVVSMWHFLNKVNTKVFGTKDDDIQLNCWPLERFVDMFCRGEVLNGPYYDHVLGYKKESLERPAKVFFITYEELKNDTKNHVKRLAEFLGCPVDNEEQLEEIVKSCSIETLKTHEVNKSNELTSWAATTYSSFFRKGQVGDYENYMTKEMIDLVDATTLEKFGGLSYDEVTKSTGK